MKLLLLCDEGHSSSILMRLVADEAARRHAGIDVACDGFTGTSDALLSADAILVAPQVAHLRDSIEAALERPTALGSIPRRIFGALDASAMLDMALELYDAYAPLREAWGVCRELAPREVLVCCAGVASSSLLAWHMQRAVDESNLHIRVEFSGVGRGKFLLDRADCVLIAPQVRYSVGTVEEFNERHVPIDLIPWRSYGRMDGKAILKRAIRLLEGAGAPPFVMDEAFRARWEGAVAAFEAARRDARARRDAIERDFDERSKAARRERRRFAGLRAGRD